ncbi:MAG: hypothetical protein Q9163_000779 [Psora crenata]
MSAAKGNAWSAPLAMAEEEMETTSESDSMDDAPPVHPVPTMQGAFEESMVETMNGDDEDKSPDLYSKADSLTRRKLLLEQQQYERTVAGRWKQKPGEKFHPLWKLVAQISFGMHLLQQGLAKSDEEVLKILQTHVDEVDGFLERTTEDFDLAQGDIIERIRYLKLPLEHSQVFDQMLADRAFRVAIVEGNEKIEHIIDRTAAAMNDALKDVQKGLDATRELAKYMTRVDKMWEDRTEEHDSVYLAMIGNTEGWTRAFLTLQSKGCHLRKALVQLGSIVAEMQRRAGAASRKNLVASRSADDRYNVDTRSNSPRHSLTPPRSPNKPLPTAPDPVARIAASQKYIKPPRSSNTSPYGNQSTTGSIKHASKKDIGHPSMQNPTLTPRSPGLSRSVRSPTPDGHPISEDSQHQGNSPQLGLGICQTSSTDPNRSVRSPAPQRLAKSPEPPRSMNRQGSQRSLSGPEPQRSLRTPDPVPEVSRGMLPFQTPAQIMARMVDATESSMPDRLLSRRKSLTERTRSILGRKLSTMKPNESGRRSTELPMEDSIDGSESNRQASPTIIQRLSSRQKHQAIRLSSYSAGPTSPDGPQSTKEALPPQEPTPQSSPKYKQNGRVIPKESSYATPSVLPTQPESPQEPNSFFNADIEQNTESPTEPPMSRNPLFSRSNNVPDDSGGSVNDAHPLLREARHARFARTTPVAPGVKSSRDLPLRHYRSQTQLAQSSPNLTQDNQANIRRLKRSSSLFQISNNPYNQSKTIETQDNEQRSAAQDQTTPNASTLNLLAGRTALPPENELGIHPAHRNPDPDSTLTISSSPALSNSSSSTEQGAIPPAASNARSPDKNPSASGFAPISTSPSPSQRKQQHEAQSSQSSQRSQADNRTKSPLPSDAENLKKPYSFNPASSTALVEFLTATPSPSSPRPGAGTEPGTPITAKTLGFFHTRALLSRSNLNASPALPGPGAAGAVSWSGKESTAPPENSSDAHKKGSGWKKVFGSSKSMKEKKEKGTKKVKGIRSKDISNPVEGLESLGLMNATRGEDTEREKELEKEKEVEKGKNGGFKGPGRDGVWLSRKNFLRH